MKAHTHFVLAALAIPFASLPARAADLFLTFDNCMACHNGLSTSKGEDVSIGFDWRASMMANSARDPYWQASVRREVRDHAGSAAAIEHECSLCHMPMAHVQERSQGRRLRQPGTKRAAGQIRFGPGRGELCLLSPDRA